jgi:hypothetical protein
MDLVEEQTDILARTQSLEIVVLLTDGAVLAVFTAVLDVNLNLVHVLRHLLDREDPPSLLMALVVARLVILAKEVFSATVVRNMAGAEVALASAELDARINSELAWLQLLIPAVVVKP